MRGSEYIIRLLLKHRETFDVVFRRWQTGRFANRPCSRENYDGHDLKATNGLGVVLVLAKDGTSDAT